MRIAQRKGLGRWAALGSLALALSGAGYQMGSGAGASQGAANMQNAHTAAKVVPAVGLTASRVVAAIHDVNQMEIVMGRLAEQKGSTASVRRYGTLLERDHKLADSELLSVAQSQHLRVSGTAPSAVDQAMIVRLQRLRGRAFDRQFLADMKAGHDQALAMLSAARGQQVNPVVRDFAGRLIPILKQHRDLSQRLEGKA